MRAIPDTAAAFRAYEAVRHRLPGARFPDRSDRVRGLADLADRADAFLLDAFGVLNVGNRVIPGAVEAVADLTARGKRVLVLSNAAGYAKRVMLARLAGFGFGFAAADVISSRDALLAALKDRPDRRWGVMVARAHAREGLEHLQTTLLGGKGADYETAEGLLLLGASEWRDSDQKRLVAALRQKPRPVLVGNPDLVAPVEGGLSREPGLFAHDLADRTGLSPEFFGKPFANVFDLARARLAGLPADRIMMVGDTLHTDILGGAAAGMQTALVTAFGALAGLDSGRAIADSGIIPDAILERP